MKPKVGKKYVIDGHTYTTILFWKEGRRWWVRLRREDGFEEARPFAGLGKG